MIKRTIACSVKGCPTSEEEPGFNKGWPKWGHVQGFVDPDTGEVIAHLCPFHKGIVARLLNGEFDRVFLPSKEQIAQLGGRQ
jgi:hypothetical protein